MPSLYLLTPSASRDVDEILEYVLENDGALRAIHLYEKLCDGFVKVSTHPGIGTRREDLADELLRAWLVASYLIIYRPNTQPVQIIRVLHGARDLRAAMEGER
jgi:plasmid stabilization system protein ParE